MVVIMTPKMGRAGFWGWMGRGVTWKDGTGLGAKVRSGDGLIN